MTPGQPVVRRRAMPDRAVSCPTPSRFARVPAPTFITTFSTTVLRRLRPSRVKTTTSRQVPFLRRILRYLSSYPSKCKKDYREVRWKLTQQSRYPPPRHLRYYAVHRLRTKTSPTLPKLESSLTRPACRSKRSPRSPPTLRGNAYNCRYSQRIQPSIFLSLTSRRYCRHRSHRTVLPFRPKVTNSTKFHALFNQTKYVRLARHVFGPRIGDIFRSIPISERVR